MNYKCLTFTLKRKKKSDWSVQLNLLLWTGHDFQSCAKHVECKKMGHFPKWKMYASSADKYCYTIVYTRAYCYRQNKSLHIVRHELKLLSDLKPTFLLCYCSAHRIPEEIIWKISTQKQKTREKDLIYLQIFSQLLRSSAVISLNIRICMIFKRVKL